jgi:hypothetical protein
VETTTLMLADDAIVAGGKLYVHGGGWDVIQLATMPATVARLALVITFRVEYDEALTDQTLVIDLVDEDDQPAAGVHLQGILAVGHPPGVRRGAPSFASQALRFESLQFDHFGGYRFRVFLNDQESPLASLPFRLVQPPT